jgi:MFS family permease
LLSDLSVLTIKVTFGWVNNQNNSRNLSVESQNSHDPYQALRFRDFRIFLGIRFLLTLSVQMQAVIVGWQLYEITSDPLSLGLIGLTEAIPALSISMYAGHIVDLFDRKKILALSYLSLLVTVVLLTFFTLYLESWIEVLGTVPIYVAIFFTGLARGFMAPANFALLSQLIPKKIYMNASTWNSSIWQIGAISGPAVGGLVYGFFNAQTGYICVGMMFILGMLLLSFLKKYPVKASKIKEDFRERLLSGVKFVFKNQIILGAISLDLFAVLFGGAVALLPVFAADILLIGPKGLGMLRSAPAVGSAIMGLILAHRSPMKNAGKNMLWAVAGFGISMIAFALSRNFYFSLFCLFLSGALDNISVVIRFTILQLLTPDDMRGRVSAVNSMFIGSSNEIGAFESGVAARLMGTVASVVFGGGMTMLTVLVTWLKSPELKNLNLAELSSRHEESKD